MVRTYIEMLKKLHFLKNEIILNRNKMNKLKKTFSLLRKLGTGRDFFFELSFNVGAHFSKTLERMVE